MNATPLYLAANTPTGSVSLPQRLLDVCKALVETTEETHVCNASPHALIKNWHNTRGALYGRYQLAEGPPIHKSATCKVYYAADTAYKAGVFRSKVVLKMMRNRDEFEREIKSRFEPGRNLSTCTIDVLGWHTPSVAPF